MTEQEKQLFVNALCGYLPYGFKYQVQYGDTSVRDVKKFILDGEYSLFDTWMIQEIKPYLRPMSSMTDEEKIELKEYLDAYEVDCNGFGYIEGGTLEDYVSRTPYNLCNYVIDWLNAHHFDYRGLIEIGLALESPEGMYNN